MELKPASSVTDSNELGGFFSTHIRFDEQRRIFEEGRDDTQQHLESAPRGIVLGAVVKHADDVLADPAYKVG